jgi:hypothetical protein
MIDETHLHALASRPLPSDSMPRSVDQVVARGDHLRRRQRLGLAAAAAVMVAVLGLAAVVVVPDGGDHDSARTADMSSMPQGWHALAEPPFTPRQASTNVWTGREMITFGGFQDNADSGVAGEGAAAYDPATDSWRDIADPPEQLRGDALAVWTGEVLVALPVPYRVLTSTEEQAGAVYDPETDEWHEIPVSDVGLVQRGSQVFWTGDRVLVAGMFDPTDQTWKMDRAATFDPATGTWDRLPDAPVVLGQAGQQGALLEPAAVWTGDRMIYVGIAIDDPAEVALDPDEQPVGGSLELPGDRYAALSLDPATGTWGELPAPPLEPRLNLSVAWTGSEVFVGGGTTVEEVDMRDSGLLDPSSGQWEPLPEMPAESQPNYNDDGGTGSASLVGGQLVFFQPAYPDDGPMLLDPATRTWSFGETHPEDVYLAATISIGDSVLVWGGNDKDTYASFDGGYAYTP